MIETLLLIGVALNLAVAIQDMKGISRTRMDILVILISLTIPYIVFFTRGMMWLLDRILELFCKVINWLNEEL